MPAGIYWECEGKKCKTSDVKEVVDLTETKPIPRSSFTLPSGWEWWQREGSSRHLLCPKCVKEMEKALADI